MKIDYSQWTQEDLIKRIETLENRLTMIEIHRHTIDRIFQNREDVVNG